MTYESTPRRGLHPALIVIGVTCGGCFLLTVAAIVFGFIVASNSPTVQTVQAQQYMSRKNYSQAAVALEKLVKRSPQDATMLNELAWCYYLDHKYDKGEPFAIRAVQIEPNAANIDTLAHIYLGQGRYVQSEARFREALKLEPNQADSLDGLAQLREKRGDIQGAVQAYRKAYNLNSSIDGLADRLSAAEDKLKAKEK